MSEKVEMWDIYDKDKKRTGRNFQLLIKIPFKKLL